MGKLKLSLDSLRVTSFETDTAGSRESGTVHAHVVRFTDSACASGRPDCFSSPDLCTGPGCDETLAPSCVECQSVDGRVCAWTSDGC